jgi:hypothetical protein
VSKSEADARAEAEYEEFADRRRALSAEAERELKGVLEDSAKNPAKRNRPKP